MSDWLGSLVARLAQAGYPEAHISYIATEVINARAEERMRLADWIKNTGMSVHISNRDGRFLVVYHRGSDDAHGHVTDPDLTAALDSMFWEAQNK